MKIPFDISCIGRIIANLVELCYFARSIDIHANCPYFGLFQIYQQQCPAKTPKKGEKSSFFYAIRSYKCIMSS